MSKKTQAKSQTEMSAQSNDFTSDSDKMIVESECSYAYLAADLPAGRKKVGFIFEHEKFTFLAKVTGTIVASDFAGEINNSQTHQEFETLISRSFRALIDWISPRDTFPARRRPILLIDERFPDFEDSFYGHLGDSQRLVFEGVKKSNISGDMWMLEITTLLGELLREHKGNDPSQVELHVATFYGELIKLTSLKDLFSFLGLVGSR